MKTKMFCTRCGKKIKKSETRYNDTLCWSCYKELEDEESEDRDLRYM